MSARWGGHDLLEPITAERPCGESLEDTPLLASFDTFRLFGQDTAPDARLDPRDREGKRLLPPPDWDEIKRLALEALSKSKDIRLLANLATASLWSDGLPAFAETLTITSQWLERYWTQTYPLIDQDAISRRSALNCFADRTSVVGRLRQLPLVVSSRHGKFSFVHIEKAVDWQAEDAAVQLDRGPIKAAFAEMPLDDLRQLQQSASDALDATKNILAAMSAGAGPDAVPDLSPLSLPLARIGRVLSAQLALRGGAVGVAAPDSGSDGAGMGGRTVAVGAITSRQDAIRAMDAVAEFFRSSEPSSPIPLFLERAKRLVSKNFLEVLADVAPEALPQAKAAGGLAKGE